MGQLCAILAMLAPAWGQETRVKRVARTAETEFVVTHDRDEKAKVPGGWVAHGRTMGVLEVQVGTREVGVVFADGKSERVNLGAAVSPRWETGPALAPAVESPGDGSLRLHNLSTAETVFLVHEEREGEKDRRVAAVVLAPGERRTVPIPRGGRLICSAIDSSGRAWRGPVSSFLRPKATGSEQPGGFRWSLLDRIDFRLGGVEVGVGARFLRGYDPRVEFRNLAAIGTDGNPFTIQRFDPKEFDAEGIVVWLGVDLDVFRLSLSYARTTGEGEGDAVQADEFGVTQPARATFDVTWRAFLLHLDRDLVGYYDDNFEIASSLGIGVGFHRLEFDDIRIFPNAAVTGGQTETEFLFSVRFKVEAAYRVAQEGWWLKGEAEVESHFAGGGFSGLPFGFGVSLEYRF